MNTKKSDDCQSDRKENETHLMLETEFKQFLEQKEQKEQKQILEYVQKKLSFDNFQLIQEIIQLEREKENKKKLIIKIRQLEEQKLKQLLPLKSDIQNNLTFSEQVQAYVVKESPEEYDLTSTLTIRVSTKIKDQFLTFGNKEGLSAKKIITYLVENFMSTTEHKN